MSVGVDVSSEKNLGLWGSIIGLVGAFVPYLGSVLALVGFILVLVALKGIGDKVKDDRPFKYYLLAFISAIGVVVIFAIVVFTSLFAFSGFGVIEETHSLVTTPEGETVVMPPHEVQHSSPTFVIAGVFLFFLVVMIVVAYFEMKTWGAMYEITGTKEFNDASTWYKWGAITAIILVGFLLMFIGRIFVILGFSNMPKELEQKGTGDFIVDSPII
ncbi:DUF996 domain-containing protein [Thermococcus thioreducens]|uniref:DUF996 domain-containing protein n=1 Tax=Thermococcus thioreducens TaxID=277988 RepID=UPI001E6579E0|nr:DUF996 domain-containing protein [Thermococcus thioreducens]